MKKHNKKRNTAFLFEALIRELTLSIVNKEPSKKDAIVEILKKHFKEGTILRKELQHFKDLTETTGLDPYTAEKLIHRVKFSYNNLDKQEIFQEQSTVIKKINKRIGSSLYGSFVPNYKSIATLAQIFGEKVSVKNKVLMENKLLEHLTSTPEKPSAGSLRSVDNLVVTTFAKAFNKKYDHLLPEQRMLLTKYIISTGLNEIDFRVYLKGELENLKESIKNSLQIKEVKEDENMVVATRKVLETVNKINISTFSEKDLLKVLKLQTLVKEYNPDAN
tara:strand:+ start:2565 stop:3392 length:828 start_codon:yes stop_codon:yes gene_type:complete